MITTSPADWLCLIDPKGLSVSNELLGFALLYPTYETDVKKAFKKSTDKIEWIKSYIEELHTTFSNLKEFEASNNPFVQRLRNLGMPAFVYPFIIKGYKYSINDVERLNALFHLMEITTFRFRLINSLVGWALPTKKITFGEHKSRWVSSLYSTYLCFWKKEGSQIKPIEAEVNIIKDTPRAPRGRTCRMGGT